MELQLQNLSRQFGRKCAVDNINATLAPGVYGLLGANGAGKTTLMRMICGVLKATSGDIRLNGKTVQELGERYYARLGYMPQDFGFYPDFTAREFMLYMAAVKGLDKKSAKSRTEELLYMVNLQEAADKKIRSYSGGMKQRLGIAQAELNHPSVLILDEPTAGLDPNEWVRTWLRTASGEKSGKCWQMNGRRRNMAGDFRLSACDMKTIWYGCGLLMKLHRQQALFPWSRGWRIYFCIILEGRKKDVNKI